MSTILRYFFFIELIFFLDKKLTTPFPLKLAQTKLTPNFARYNRNAYLKTQLCFKTIHDSFPSYSSFPFITFLI